MKIIRKRSSVSVCEWSGDSEKKEDTEITLEDFDNDPGYYKNVIRPMLAKGHEGELVIWMKTIGLLRNTQRCNNVVDNSTCQGVMNWTPARIVDNYQWKCKNCSKKYTIRGGSVFQDVRCRLKEALRSVAGWSKGIDVDTMAKLLCIKKQAVDTVYNITADVAHTFIRSNIKLWRLGGPGTIVLIDTYPEGLSKLDSFENYRTNNFLPILCFAEVKEIPPRYWLQLLDRFNMNNVTQVQNANTTALQIIQEIVTPGSILVTNFNTRICSYDTLQSLKHLYPIIVSIEGLKRHDNLNRFYNDLEAIWKTGLNICIEAQYYSYSQMQSFIINQLWRQQFKNESFETLLNQMCYNFV